MDANLRQPITFTDKKINALVYESYGLTNKKLRLWKKYNH